MHTHAACLFAPASPPPVCGRDARHAAALSESEGLVPQSPAHKHAHMQVCKVVAVSPQPPAPRTSHWSLQAPRAHAKACDATLCAVLQPERWRGALHRAAMHLAHAMHKHMHMPCMSSDVIENWKKCEHAGFPFMRIPFTLPHRAG